VAQTETLPQPGIRIGIPQFLRHRITARILSVLLFLLAWQVITPYLPTSLIPMPAEVFSFMWDEIRGITVGRTTVWQAFGISLRRLGLGYLIAFAIGLPLGVLTGLSKWTDRMLRDFVLVGLAMPALVWALLTGIWFGLDGAAPVMTVVLAAVPFVIINTQEGVRDVPRDLSDMARAYHVSRSHIVRHVILPSLMPFFFAALRYGLANGWKGLVLAEVFAATSGAGWNIKFWHDAHRPQGLVGYALFFILFALFVERVIFQRISNRVFRWRPDAAAAEAKAAQFQQR
jgi:ABC-type nitrate/sulfonate/bicarbonate transport system permease component